MAMRLNGASKSGAREDVGRTIGPARGRGVKVILVAGLSSPAIRALGRLVGKYFYVEKVADANECVRRLRSDDGIGGIVIDPGLSEFDAPSFTALVRKHRPELPLFFYGSVQDIGPIRANAGPELIHYFKNPSDICRMAETIVVELTNRRVTPLLRHPKDTIVSRALEFIEANYRTIRKVEDISNHVGVSREHLSRQFTRYAGHRLSEFVNIFRIERAKELLLEGVLVKQVFSQVGFRCSSSFFKAFLKHTGIAPSVYKDAMLARRRARLAGESSRGSSGRQ